MLAGSAGGAAKSRRQALSPRICWAAVLCPRGDSPRHGFRSCACVQRPPGYLVHAAATPRGADEMCATSAASRPPVAAMRRPHHPALGSRSVRTITGSRPRRPVLRQLHLQAAAHTTKSSSRASCCVNVSLVTRAAGSLRYAPLVVREGGQHACPRGAARPLVNPAEVLDVRRLAPSTTAVTTIRPRGTSEVVSVAARRAAWRNGPCRRRSPQRRRTHVSIGDLSPPMYVPSRGGDVPPYATCG